MVLSGEYRYLGFGGGIRGTKTWGALMVFIILAKLYPGSRWAVVRKDLERIRKTTIPSFNKLRRTTGAFVGPVNGQTFEATCQNGSVIIFRGENIDRDPDLDSFDGYEVNGFLLEEGDECHEATFYKCIERAGAWVLPDNVPQPLPLVLSTFNPNAAWPKRVFYDPWSQGQLAPPYGFIPATIDDNLAMTEEYRESLKNLPPEEYEIRVGGDWSKISGRYYRSINRGVHLIPRSRLPAPLPSWWEYWGAFDWGYQHWAVFGAFARDGDGTIYLLASVWMRRQQDDELATTLVAAAADGVFPDACLHEVYAGSDCWAKVTAHGASGVTTADVFDERDIVLFPADTDLINGGRAVRRVTAVKPMQDRDGQPIYDDQGRLRVTSGVYLVETADNIRVFEQLASVVPDENNINKPGKQDANEHGQGGDDGADMFRYGIATRIGTPTIPYEATEAAQQRRKLDPISRREAESFDALAQKHARHVPAKYRER